MSFQAKRRQQQLKKEEEERRTNEEGKKITLGLDGAIENEIADKPKQKTKTEVRIPPAYIRTQKGNHIFIGENTCSSFCIRLQ